MIPERGVINSSFCPVTSEFEAMDQLYIVPAGTIPCVPLAGVKSRFPPLQS